MTGVAMLRAAVLLALLTPLSVHASVFDHPADAAALRQLLEPVTAGLRDARTLRGDFTQQRFLRDLPQPLRADGRFVFVRDRGMVWRTVRPFASELAITADALVQRDGPDAEAVRLSAGDHPGVRLVARLFFAVFALDFEALDRLFELYGTRTGGQWQLGLRPRQAALAATLKEVVVSGGAQVEQVVMRDARDERTEIRLQQVAAHPAAPPAEELRQLFP